jgi:peptide/nickel transport system substrate-binding protein
VLGWLGLVILIIAALVAQNLTLSNHYQTLSAVPGGIYNEGVLGRFTTANPIFATTDADTTVSHLVFSGLLTYDTNGKLVGDLASDFSVDSHGNTYTLHLRPNLKWHDGQPLTSADVLFTFQQIQNPDIQSPLQSSWQGVEVTTPDARTVVFKLPGVLVSFPHSLTTGIIPKHMLANIKPTDMRSADFNTVHPIGAGPFTWEALEVNGDGNPKHAEEKIALKAFKDYALEAPKLQGFVVQIFSDKDRLIQRFAANQLNGVEGLTEMPDALKKIKRINTHNFSLNAANMVFFKTSGGILADSNIRKALVLGANVPDITNNLDYTTRLVHEPILIGQVGYDRSLAQPTNNLQAAKSLLDSSGWNVDTKQRGIRTKSGVPLSFSLTVADAPEYHMVADKLHKQWLRLGVKLDIQYLDPNDFQNALAYHSYESILYGIAVGSDSDVFVYWDSSQADIRSANRLNLSEYKNSTADAALEAGRTRLDPVLRVIKYKPFLQAWQADNPALGLYQPRLLYLTNGRLSGLTDAPINNATERFINVHNWQIREAKVTNK